MKVILKERVKNLGNLGDLVEVKRGYARNYLLPSEKALVANKKNLADFEKQKVKFQHIEKKRLEEIEKQFEKLSGNTITITAKSGENGKLFGSIGSKEVSCAIQESLNMHIDKKKIKIDKNKIRSLGEFKLPIKLGSDKNLFINVKVIKE